MGLEYAGRPKASEGSTRKGTEGASHAGGSFPEGQLAALQRTYGNRAVLQMMKRGAPGGSGRGVIQREEAAGGKKEAHLAAFKARCAKYKAIDASFVATFEKYVDNLVAGNKDEGMPLFSQVIAYLNKIRAFEIPAHVFNDVSDPAKAAEQYTQNINLWSKTNRHMPTEKANASGGITLEGSLAGALFDGLDFGVDYDTSDLLKAQWKQVSLNFVKNAKGTVTAHMLIGVNQKSVLYNTEAEVIGKKLESGEVTAVVLHYYKAVLKGVGDFEMQEFKEETVQSKDAWDKVLASTESTIPLGEVDTPTGKKTVVAKVNANGQVFRAIQNLTHVAEEKRHAQK
jgi:hypothetical protein